MFGVRAGEGHQGTYGVRVGEGQESETTRAREDHEPRGKGKGRAGVGDYAPRGGQAHVGRHCNLE